MVRKTWFQSQVASYQRLLKWYWIPPCLTLSNIRYVSRVKCSNPGKAVAPSPWPRCKGSLLVALDYGRQLYRLKCMHVLMHVNIYNKDNIWAYSLIKTRLRKFLSTSILGTHFLGESARSWKIEFLYHILLLWRGK